MSTESELTREELLALIPPQAQRLKVRDEAGQLHWRNIGVNPASLLDSDELVLKDNRPIVMMKKVGRKPGYKASDHVPPPVNLVASQLKAAKVKHLHKDALYKSVAHSVDSENVLHFAMLALAEESASLGFERVEAERKGKETSQLSIRRIGAIKALVDSWLKRKDQLTGKSIDLHSPAFAKLFAFMVDTFREAMLHGGIPPDQAETIFVALSERMGDETWEQEARNHMKGA